MLGFPLPLTIQPSEKCKFEISKGPQLPRVLRSLWIDVKRRVENLSYIFRAPKSNHIKADLTSLPPVLNKRAPKDIRAVLKAKAGTIEGEVVPIRIRRGIYDI